LEKIGKKWKKVQKNCKKLERSAKKWPLFARTNLPSTDCGQRADLDVIWRRETNTFGQKQSSTRSPIWPNLAPTVSANLALRFGCQTIFGLEILAFLSLEEGKQYWPKWERVSWSKVGEKWAEIGCKLLQEIVCRTSFACAGIPPADFLSGQFFLFLSSASLRLA